MSYALRTENLKKVFYEGETRVEALRGVSFQASCGEIVVLEGPSGSGKTTFMSVAGCLLSPDDGSLFIDDRKVDFSNAQSMAAVRRDFVGFVFQSFNLLPALTVMENVMYSLQIRNKMTARYRAEAAALINKVGLGHRKTFHPEKLSGGEKQRAAIARALAGGTKIIFADEPTANLDSGIGNEILEVFRNMAKSENRTIVIATHDPRVEKIADRIVKMKDGHLLPV